MKDSAAIGGSRVGDQPLNTSGLSQEPWVHYLDERREPNEEGSVWLREVPGVIGPPNPCPVDVILLAPPPRHSVD